MSYIIDAHENWWVLQYNNFLDTSNIDSVKNFLYYRCYNGNYRFDKYIIKLFWVVLILKIHL